MGIDPSQFVDTQVSARIDFLLEASQPFTKNNSILPPNILHNVLTDTLQLSLKNQIANWEGQLSDFLKDKGVIAATSAGVNTPDNVIEGVLHNPAWANPSGLTWLDNSMQIITNNASTAHHGLGLVYQALGQNDLARAEFDRSLILKPTYADPKQALDDQTKKWETSFSSYLKIKAQTVPTDTSVPDATIQGLLANPAWADVSKKTWLDPALVDITNNAAIYHYGYGLYYQRTGQNAQAQSEYNRALQLKPTYIEAQQALQGLK